MNSDRIYLNIITTVIIKFKQNGLLGHDEDMKHNTMYYGKVEQGEFGKKIKLQNLLRDNFEAWPLSRLRFIISNFFLSKPQTALNGGLKWRFENVKQGQYLL